MRIPSRLRSLWRRLRKPGRKSAGGQPAVTGHTVEQFALVAAGIVIIVLTAGAFWLSYAHLAGIAGQHGLASSPMRRWAWPATLDAFIIAGELLMLRASLRRVTDWWAVGVTVIGSAGSIVLNVAGVSGTGNPRAVPLLDYVVAAVPPAAAMVAFAVLMRQVHQLVERPVSHPDSASVQVPEPSAATSVRPTETLATELGQSAGAWVEHARPDELPALPGPATGLPADVSVHSPESPVDPAESKPRGGRPPGAPLEDLVEIGRAAAAEQGKLTRTVIRTAVQDKELTIGSDRLTEVMDILRPEFEPSAATGPARG